MKEPYRPSSGTEGMCFMERFCENCIHENPDPESDKKCEIATRALFCDIDDPDYPTEWVYQNNEPICTAFVKWDWGNDGDPDDPDNPNAPVPEDPNQMKLFPLYPNESTYDPIQKENIVAK